jgi:hypothetical protein
MYTTRLKNIREEAQVETTSSPTRYIEIFLADPHQANKPTYGGKYALR